MCRNEPFRRNCPLSMTIARPGNARSSSHIILSRRRRIITIIIIIIVRVQVYILSVTI